MMMIIILTASYIGDDVRIVYALAIYDAVLLHRTHMMMMMIIIMIIASYTNDDDCHHDNGCIVH